MAKNKPLISNKYQLPKKGLSVICPFYNEKNILEYSIKTLIQQLKKLDLQWELILVDDGSIDNGPDSIKELLEEEKRVFLYSYTPNKGRGFALRTGLSKARYPIIITQEIDLSWGLKIAGEIYGLLAANPHIDAVFASPNRHCGGYIGVPFHRIFISKLGNLLFQFAISKRITMYTGMTRGYRKKSIAGIKNRHNGKVFHVEMAVNLLEEGANIQEVPAWLSWKCKDISRKSSTAIWENIISHLKLLFRLILKKYTIYQSAA